MASKKLIDDRIFLSPSGLKAWYDAGCPRRWHYDRDWRPKEPNEFIETGIETHAVMAGAMDLDEAKWKNTPMFQEKLQALINLSGLMKVGKPELEQQFEILPGVVWTRILDQLARTTAGTLIALDYKTTGAGWKFLENTFIAPQALGTQSIGYLYRPPATMEVWDWPAKPDWPETLWYLVVSFRGPGNIIPYQYTRVDEENFFGLLRGAVAAIREARASNWPRAYGRNCLGCPFDKMCFNLDGHEKFYEKKPKRK